MYRIVKKILAGNQGFSPFSHALQNLPGARKPYYRVISLGKQLSMILATSIYGVYHSMLPLLPADAHVSSVKYRPDNLHCYSFYGGAQEQLLLKGDSLS